MWYIYIFWRNLAILHGTASTHLRSIHGGSRLDECRMLQSAHAASACPKPITTACMYDQFSTLTCYMISSTQIVDSGEMNGGWLQHVLCVSEKGPIRKAGLLVAGASSAFRPVWKLLVKTSRYQNTCTKTCRVCLERK
jgi:hypothetical protein